MLIVVLGHERCGTVIVTVASMATDVMPPRHIWSLVTAIRPSIEASKGTPSDAIQNAMAAHVRRTVAALEASGPVIADAIERGRLEIVGAEYHLASGRVGFMA